ncbi:MAG: hypothetical protein WC438_04475 [Candidatus Pacearchaeota archaeon]
MEKNEKLERLKSYVSNAGRGLSLELTSTYIVEAIDSGANSTELRKIFLEYAPTLNHRMHDPTYG